MQPAREHIPDSVTRTVVPVVAGLLIAQTARIGLSLPEGIAERAADVLCIGAYYYVGRLVERVRPTIGRVMLSLGLAKRRPVYVDARPRTASRP